jgi:hypothetical protein
MNERSNHRLKTRFTAKGRLLPVVTRKAHHLIRERAEEAENPILMRSSSAPEVIENCGLRREKSQQREKSTGNGLECKARGQ